MKCATVDIINRAKKKAIQSSCRYKIAAIGLDFRGKVIGVKYNTQRFYHKGGGLHAEMSLMRSSPKSLSIIILVRVNKNGKLKPIHPCKACSEKASDLGITIRSI